MFKKIIRSPITTVALFLLAAGLLLTGTIGGVRAAPLTLADRTYLASMELSDIGVAIVETSGGTTTTLGNGGVLLENITGGEKFKIGKTYDEVLSVVNSGDIDEYVRVSVYRYWTDGDKRVDLDPSLISIEFAEGNGWTIDTDSSTAERTVLYYNAPIAANGGGTSEFMKSITIDGKIVSAVDEDDEYTYGDVEFHVEVVADAVQQHNGTDAMTSAWGRTNDVG